MYSIYKQLDAIKFGIFVSTTKGLVEVPSNEINMLNNSVYKP